MSKSFDCDSILVDLPKGALLHDQQSNPNLNYAWRGKNGCKRERERKKKL